MILLTFYVAFVTVKWIDDRDHDACVSQAETRVDVRDILDRNHDLLDGILLYLDEQNPEPSPAIVYLRGLVEHARDDVDTDYPALTKDRC